MLKTLVKSRSITFSLSRFHSTNWEEVKIPVPWGQVAGKWWGPKDKRPILASHGWLDNSGTYDTLIPLLPKTSFLAIDFPGCGYSTKLPPGLFYHFIDHVILLRRIVKYFKWPKVSLIGHSMGAMINYTYTMLYPDEVDFLICLDGFSPLSQDKGFVQKMAEQIIDFLKYDYQNSLNEEPPSYPYEEILKKINGNFLKSVDLDKCKYIADRNINVSSIDPNKYYFTIDPRSKILNLLRWSEHELVENASRLTCPIFLMKVDQSPFFKRKEYATKVIDIISKNNQNFEVHELKGKHHLHLNSPECIADLINKFMKKYDIGDRTESGFRNENLVSR